MTVPHTPEWQLRVLDGQQAGAALALPPGSGVRMLRWGDAPWSEGVAGDDVLLRAGGEGPPTRLRLQRDEGPCTLTLQEGSAQLDAQPLPSQQATPWPPYVPLEVGDVRLMWGDAAVADWAQAAAAAAARTRQQAQAGATAALAPPATGPQPERWLAAAGGVLVLGAALLAAALPALEAQGPHAQAAVTTWRQALAASPYAGLTLHTPAGGEAVLTGRQASVGQGERLAAWVRAQRAAGLPPLRVQVQVDEALAQGVAEVYRLHGMAVRTQVQDDGVVDVHTSAHDAARLAQAQEAARRDVAGLREVRLHAGAAPPSPPQALPDDPGKRLAAVVADVETPYFVTADGGRYFTGALLPSGHRVTQIAAQTVWLERAGEVTRLTL